MAHIDDSLTRVITDLTHPSLALVRAARLEQMLQDIIEYRMPHLSNLLRRKIFEGYGPLSSFSTKIDLAYAMGFIDSRLREDLNAIREVRNKFAHSGDPLTFTDRKLDKAFAKFRNAPRGKNRYDLFNDLTQDAGRRLLKAEEPFLMAQAIEGNAKAKRS